MLLGGVICSVVFFISIEAACFAGGTKRIGGSVVFHGDGHVMQVPDGDTLWIGIRQVRLHGIATPESGQQYLKDNKKFLCQLEAMKILEEFASKPDFGCEVEIGKSDKPVVRYNRYADTCYSGDVLVNEALVSQGWACAAHTVEGDRYHPRESK